MPNHLVNISIDDVSPHPLSSTRVLERCRELIRKFPDIKFTLFVPTSYWRTVKKEIATKHPLQLDMFPEFCEEIRNLPKSNFEIGYHGHHHGIPGVTDNDEMKSLSYENSGALLEAMKTIVERSGLEGTFKKIIRPPAWRMSAHAIRRFRDEGFEVFALSPDEYALETYEDEYKKRDDVIFYNVCPPFKEYNLFPKTEIVYHACEWDKNYLSEEMSETLSEFLSDNIEDIKFSFMKDML